MTVSRLISLFESLDSRNSSSHPMARTSSQRPRTPVSMTDVDSLSPLSTLCVSLHDAFHGQTHHHAYSPCSSPSTTTISPYSSQATSPSSSLRASKRYSTFSRPLSFAPFPPPSFGLRSSSRSRSSLRLLRRRPSAVDLALEAERQSAHHHETLGLALLEPRPVLEVPVSLGFSQIFDGTPLEEDCENQPFVMGGSLEVMEGQC